jgi:hypothetical protein
VLTVYEPGRCLLPLVSFDAPALKIAFPGVLHNQKNADFVVGQDIMKVARFACF